MTPHNKDVHFCHRSVAPWLSSLGPCGLFGLLGLLGSRSVSLLGLLLHSVVVVSFWWHLVVVVVVVVISVYCSVSQMKLILAVIHSCIYRSGGRVVNDWERFQDCSWPVSEWFKDSLHFPSIVQVLFNDSSQMVWHQFSMHEQSLRPSTYCSCPTSATDTTDTTNTTDIPFPSSPFSCWYHSPANAKSEWIIPKWPWPVSRQPRTIYDHVALFSRKKSPPSIRNSLWLFQDHLCHIWTMLRWSEDCSWIDASSLTPRVLRDDSINFWAGHGWV